MTSPSRRTFIAAAGASSATLALGLAQPAYAADLSAPGQAGDATANGPLVAYVADPTAGRVVVVRGDRRAVFTDRRVAARLAETAAGGQR